MKYRLKVDTNQKILVEVLRKRGFYVRIIGKPVDLLVSKHGKDIMVEIKDPKKEGQKYEYTIAQKKFFKEWTGRSIPTLRTVEDALKFEIP